MAFFAILAVYAREQRRTASVSLFFRPPVAPKTEVFRKKESLLAVISGKNRNYVANTPKLFRSCGESRARSGVVPRLSKSNRPALTCSLTNRVLRLSSANSFGVMFPLANAREEKAHTYRARPLCRLVQGLPPARLRRGDAVRGASPRRNGALRR